MHIAQLFHAFLLGEHDKIVEAALPNVSHSDGSAPKRVYLGTGFGAKFAQQPIGRRSVSSRPAPAKDFLAPAR